MNEVFISYANEDQARIELLVAALEKQGFSSWWDRHIPPGKTWRQVIESALSNAKCVIVVWTLASVASEWVQTEAEDARERRILVPVLLDDIRIPLEFRRIHAARLVGWSGDDRDPAFVELCGAIANLVPVAMSTEKGHAVVASVAVGERTMVKSERSESSQPANPERTLVGHEEEVSCVAITPDGKCAVSGSWDESLKVWDLVTGELLTTIEGHEDRIYTVALTPDGRRAICGGRGFTLDLWDLETSSLILTFDEECGGSINCVTVTPDGGHVVSASADDVLRLWDLESGALLHTIEDEDEDRSVNSLAVTPDGRRAVCASDESTLKVWDLETGRLVRTMQRKFRRHPVYSNPMNCVALTPDGRHAVSGDSSINGGGLVMVWELANGRLRHTMRGHDNTVTCVAVTPDGRDAIAGDASGSLLLWDLTSGSLLKAMKCHENGVTCVAISPDGRKTVSGSRDMTLKVWSPKCLRRE